MRRGTTPTRTSVRVAVAGLALGAAALVAPSAAAAPSPGVISAHCAAPARTAVTWAASDAGHRHATVTMTAAPDAAPCTVEGHPTRIVMVADDTNEYPLETRDVGMPQPVVFGPGHPITFDLTTRNAPNVPVHYLMFETTSFTATSTLDARTAISGPVEVTPFAAG